ncbi:MAG: hypothetical protein M1818_004782 [Claussenomyces sp. TS43310]|nr:MAG: hypothetical protein M1818_004782 [Claussenomyces sp. TS43310]
MREMRITASQAKRVARKLAEATHKAFDGRKTAMLNSMYIEQCMILDRNAGHFLRLIYQIFLRFCHGVAKAASDGFLDELSLEQLKAETFGTSELFHEMCVELGEPAHGLARDSDAWWRVKKQEPHAEELSHQFLDANPKNVSTAFPKSSKTGFALNFLVSFFSLIAAPRSTPILPAHLQHSPATSGHPDGRYPYRLPSPARVPVVVLDLDFGGLSAARSVVAIPLYLYAPTEWSAACSFAGNVMEAVVSLELTIVI